MAHRSSAPSIWTSVLAALVALLAVFGFGRKAAPAAPAGVAAPVVPAVAVAAARRPALMARRTWRAMMRGGSLPPTLKQRIRAEAHGKTPSVRRSTTALAAGTPGASRCAVPSGTVLPPVRVAAGAAVGARDAARSELALAA